jgi:hypothetical protein
MTTTPGIRSLSAWPEVHLLAPPALGECCHRSLAGRGIAVGRAAVFVVPDVQSDTGLNLLDNDQHFLDNRWGDLCFGIQ